MTSAEKMKHPWACDLSRGHQQCQFVKTHSDDGLLFCCWQRGHPESLPHSDSYNDPPQPRQEEWFLLERDRVSVDN